METALQMDTDIWHVFSSRIEKLAEKLAARPKIAFLSSKDYKQGKRIFHYLQAKGFDVILAYSLEELDELLHKTKIACALTLVNDKTAMKTANLFTNGLTGIKTIALLKLGKKESLAAYQRKFGSLLNADDVDLDKLLLSVKGYVEESSNGISVK